MLDRLQLPLAVCHADVAAQKAFSRAASYFKTGVLDRDWWKDVRTLGRLTEPLTFTEPAFVIVEGDVLGEVNLSDEGTVVVYGNVHSSIHTTGQCEVIVAGDILQEASVSGDGILHLFVGGDFIGRLRSLRSCKAWVEGHLRGQLWTGIPLTELFVRGDFTGTIRPSEKPALLYLQVGGFMLYTSLEETAAVGYTEFNASVGRSDRPAGLYPDKAVDEALRQHRSYNRWVIRDTTGQC
jgi:hypothetical protein